MPGEGDAQDSGCPDQEMLRTVGDPTRGCSGERVPGTRGCPGQGVPRQWGAPDRGCRCIHWGPLAAHPGLG